MDPTLNALFGPLSRKYCIWFYWLSIIGFIYLVITIIGALYLLMNKKMNGKYMVQMFGAVSVYLIFYFQNRLLYTMCSGSA